MSLIPLLHLIFGCSDTTAHHVDLLSLEDISLSDEIVQTQLSKIDSERIINQNTPAVVYNEEIFSDDKLIFELPSELEMNSDLAAQLNVDVASLRAERWTTDSLRAERFSALEELFAVSSFPEGEFFEQAENILGETVESIPMSVLMAQIIVLSEEHRGALYIPLRAERFNSVMFEVVDFASAKGVDCFDVSGSLL